MATKDEIISEIRRAAAANGGKAPGRRQFEAVTGIRTADWLGRYWARWGDAVREAGLEVNALNQAYPAAFLLGKYADLATELGRLPTQDDLRLRHRHDREYPDAKVFERLGTKADLIAKVEAHCRSRSGFKTVVSMCSAYRSRTSAKTDDSETGLEAGVVYLMRSGRNYKIGRSNSAGRREYELAIQLPDRATTIHTIRTDDTVGIEAYWHRRFADKRKNGEWFDLSAADVAAFKRRKSM